VKDTWTGNFQIDETIILLYHSFIFWPTNFICLTPSTLQSIEIDRVPYRVLDLFVVAVPLETEKIKKKFHRNITSILGEDSWE